MRSPHSTKAAKHLLLLGALDLVGIECLLLLVELVEGLVAHIILDHADGSVPGGVAGHSLGWWGREGRREKVREGNKWIGEQEIQNG